VGRETEISELLGRGAYAEIVARTVDAKDARIEPRDLAWVIGALMFVGRLDDATLLYAGSERRLTHEAHVASRFFLSVGNTRVSRYGEARRLVAENLLALRSRAMTPRARFFAWQGAAFFRYFGCRFGLAARNARRAWDAAFLGSYHYGQMLAAELMGYALVRSGEVSLGLRRLEDSVQIGGRLGNAQIREVFAISSAALRAQHGIDGDAGLLALETLAATLDPQNDYSLASLHIELARQYAIRGRLGAAEGFLDRAARFIFASRHRRQKATLHHRYAYLRFLAGHFSESLALLEKAQAEVDPAVDLSIELEILGLRLAVLEARDGAAPDDLVRRVEQLTLRSGTGIGRRILARRRGEHPSGAHGDDPVGDVKDLAAKGAAADADDVLRIVRSGLLTFLRETTTLRPGENAVYFDLVPGTLLVVDNGSVDYDDTGVSHTLKILAKLLSRGRASKKDLVEQIWGYDYHPLRHDQLLYSVTARLRRLLGARAEWLVAEDGGYAFVPGLRITVHEHVERAGGAAAPAPVRSTPREPVAVLDDALNRRQLLIMAALVRESFIDVATCVKRFEVSRVTALRDLQELCGRGLVRRVGRARATAYCIAVAAKSEADRVAVRS
jgi:tetratricopeptide (TPR) repeat protein